MQEMIVCIHSATTYAKWIKTRRGHVQRLVVPKKISVSNFRYGYLYSCLGKEETNYVSSVLMFSLYRLTKESRLIRKIIVYTLLRISLIFTRKSLRSFEGFLQATLLAMLQETLISVLCRVVFTASAQLGQTSDYKSETAPDILWDVNLQLVAAERSDAPGFSKPRFYTDCKF